MPFAFRFAWLRRSSRPSNGHNTAIYTSEPFISRKRSIYA
jgi:hypothetical protein